MIVDAYTNEDDSMLLMLPTGTSFSIFRRSVSINLPPLSFHATYDIGASIVWIGLDKAAAIQSLADQGYYIARGKA